MNAQLSLTLYFAVEVERSTAAIVWHYPEHLGLVQRELDPNVHFTLLAHRYVLEAIAIVGEKCGVANWISVLECVCEIPGAFDECGGREGLDQIFTDGGHYPESVSASAAEAILKDHVRFLKEAAIVRGVDPTKPVLHYTVGLGFLRRNKLAISSRHPVATGNARFLGHDLRIAAWPDGVEQMKLRFELEGSMK